MGLWNLLWKLSSFIAGDMCYKWNYSSLHIIKRYVKLHGFKWISESNIT